MTSDPTTTSHCSIFMTDLTPYSQNSFTVLFPVAKCGFKSRKTFKKCGQVLLAPAGIPSWCILYFWCTVWSYLRWLVTLKDVTFAAQWYYVLASTVSITAARCKCSLSPKEIPFPKAVLCQDESSMSLPELTQRNSNKVHGIIQNLI